MQSLRSRRATAEQAPWPATPIPIALVITDLDVGGAEKAMAALATGLDRSRWRPSVVCLGPEAALCKPLREAGLDVVCLDVSRRRPAWAVVRLAGSLRRLRPHLVQSFLFHANIASKLAAPMAGNPWVVGGIRVAEREKRWHLGLERRTQRLSAGSICVSEGVREHAIRAGGLDPDRLVVVPNGIDVAPLDHAEPTPRSGLGPRESDRLALFVGRLAPQKNLPLLVEGFASFAATHPGWSLAIVGEGPELGSLLASMERSGLGDRLVWLGRRRDVPALMKAADSVVLTSRWEGMPNVLLEAMAARRPIVATPVEGVTELLSTEEGSRTGWPIESPDPEGLRAALAAAASSVERFGAIGDNGRRLVEDHYSMGRVVEAYERVWAGLLGYDRGLKVAT